MNITKVEKLTDERWLNLFAAHFEHRGKTGRWLYASRRKPHEATKPLASQPTPIDAVVIVPLVVSEETTKLVLIREFRVPVGGYMYGLPAGLIDPGEGVEETVRRELKEETGLDLVRIKRTSQGLFSSSGMTDEAIALAFVDVEGDVANQPKLDSSEEIEPVLFDYDEVCRLCEDREAHIDVKAWMVLNMYCQLGELK